MRADIEASGLHELGEYLPFAAVAQSLPSTRGGKPVHPSTIGRWRSQGVPGRDGSRIKLRAVRLPSGWATTLEWVREFFDAMTADKEGEPAPAPEVRTPASRRRQIERANRELDAIGI